MSSTVDPQHNGTATGGKKEFEWTILLYMAGDNNLSEECVYALTEIKTALRADQPRLKVVAQFDPAGTRAETKRYELQSGTTLERDAQKTGWRVKETDTGEPNNLRDFLLWGMSTFDSEHYMVVLVGHGTGTDDDFLRDDNPANSISIPELQGVFEVLKKYKIDILGMDTCLMSMAEVCYEMRRNNITYMVGSEGFAPNTGWPYASIISELSDKISSAGYKSETDRARSVAKMIVDKYKEFYRPYINGGISVDQSVLEVSKIGEVQKAMSGLVKALMDDFDQKKVEYRSAKQDALQMAHWEAQSYNGEVFVDLYDFCQLLEERYKDVSVDKSCKEVRDAITKVVVRSVVSGAAFQFSYGLSIYFPWAALSPQYGKLTFPESTGWADFLDKYHEKTRRMGRDSHRGNGINRGGDGGGGGGAETSLSNQLEIRATVPANKGRSGEVASMRNPPHEEFVGAWPDPQLPDGPPKRRSVKPIHPSNGGRQKRTSVSSKKNSSQTKQAKSGR